MTPGEQIGPPWPSNWVGQLIDLHHATTGGFLPGGQVSKLVKPAQKHLSFTVLLAAWGRFVASPESKYGPGYFMRQMGDYLMEAPSKQVFRGLLTEDQVREFGGFGR